MWLRRNMQQYNNLDLNKVIFECSWKRVSFDDAYVQQQPTQHNENTLKTAINARLQTIIKLIHLPLMMALTLRH